MFSTLVTVALFAAAAINGAAAQQLTVATPQMTTCQPVDITWSSTQGPYNVIMTAPGECDALVDLGDQDGTSVNWTPNVAPGTQLEVSVVDSQDQEAWSGTITVAQGSDTSCVSPQALAAASSSSVAVVSTDTTSVVTDSTTPSPSPSPSNAGPLGAVGNNGPIEASNGAMTHATTPIMILSAVVGILAFSL